MLWAQLIFIFIQQLCYTSPCAKLPLIFFYAIFILLFLPWIYTRNPPNVAEKLTEILYSSIITVIITTRITFRFQRIYVLYYSTFTSSNWVLWLLVYGFFLYKLIKLRCKLSWDDLMITHYFQDGHEWKWKALILIHMEKV